MLIVREAGGLVTDLDGDTDVLTKGSVLAGNEYIHGALLAAIKNA
jgi:myo-inositol-1(or 4)-monophosphatase